MTNIFNLVDMSLNPPSSSNQPMLWFALSPRDRMLTLNHYDVDATGCAEVLMNPLSF